MDDEVGVGPWPGGPGAWPPVGPGSPYDPALLAEGDRRNVVDQYRYWSVEAVVADLDTHRSPLHVAFENTAHDLNVGSVVRTANAYNVAGIHVVGRRRWNRRGAMVTDRYLHLHHHGDTADLFAWAGAAGLPVLGVDNIDGSVPIETYPLPRGCVLLFGTESTGLSPQAVAGCQAVAHITQHGSTRSLNLGAAAAIAIYAWAVRHLP
ncbi:MAG: RNA methyltransferase [Micrococcales bacterium]|nr:RNA methyltransferase [Micrococcales bacterium]MCL2667147.1 RNA methyltransferase [Micrococcales bacterium]